MSYDEQLLANPEDEKPEPPPDFDEEAVKQKVANQCNGISNLPREPCGLTRGGGFTSLVVGRGK